MRRLLFALCCAFAIAAYASPLGPDGQTGLTLPGKFVWLDLATENPARARAFYGAVFGWKFREAAGAPASYTVAQNANGNVAGIFRQMRPAGSKTGARWLALISVRDAASVARVVREHGGEVVLPPRRIAGRGTHAVFRDADGAVFGVLAAEGGDPPDTPVEDGDVFWLDLFAREPGKAAAFYGAVAGYEVDVGEVAGRTRTLLSTNGIERAGVARQVAGVAHAGWLPYILVDDVAATLARAQQARGKVVYQPRSDLLDGNLAVIADPDGGVIGIVNWLVPGAQGGAR